MSDKSVFVIILNWNHIEDLRLTLESFIIQTCSGLNIIVADNGSTDGSIELLKSEYPGVILIDNKENIGFAAGNNRAIEYAISQNADFVLLANNDIYIDNPGLISQIIEDISSCNIDNVGVYGIQERNYFEQGNVISNGWILFEDMQKENKQFNNSRSNLDMSIKKPYKVVDFVSGSFILIDSKVFNICGLLDEAFYMYHEEAEFCYRAWLHNFKVLVNTSLHYYHKEAQTAGTRTPFSIYYRMRNNYYFLFKHRKNINHYWYFLYSITSRNVLGFIKLTFSLIFKFSTNKNIWLAQYMVFKDVVSGNYYRQKKVNNQNAV